MRKYLLLVLLATSLLVYGQRSMVNAASPIGQISYDRVLDRLVIRVSLQGAGSSVSRCDSRLFELGELTVNSDGKITIINAQPSDYANLLEREYWVRIGNGQPLSNQWEELGFSFRYRCAQPKSAFSGWTQSPAFTILRTVEDPAQNQIYLAEPDWYLQRPLFLPIKTSEDVQVEVKMTEINGVEIATGAGLVRKEASTTGENWSTIELSPLPGRLIAPGTKYVFKATGFRNGRPLMSKQLEWSSGKPINPYLVSPEPTQQKLTATRGDMPFLLSVTTTEPGEVRAVFEKSFRADSKPSIIEAKCSDDRKQHLLEVKLEGVEDGLYPFHFEGKSEAGRPLLDTDRKFVLSKNTTTSLAKPIIFRIDEAGKLQIEYWLSRQVPNSLLMGKKETPFPAEAVDDRVADGPFHYRVSVDITQAANFEPFKDAVSRPGATRGPVDFSIVSNASDRKDERILNFQLDAVRLDQATVAKKLSEAASQLEGKSPDVKQARETIKSALGVKNDSEAEKEAVDYVLSILKTRDKTKTTKFLEVLKFAAKVATSYFGVPVA